MLKNEVWKYIENFNNMYQISNYGRIKSFYRYKNGHILSMEKRKKRYVIVELVKHAGNKREKVFKNVHRLVAEAFIPNYNNLPEINHIDGNPANNAVNNLEWCTSQYNSLHRHKLHPNLCKCEHNSRTRLTNDQALSIYYLAWTKDYKMKDIAILFGVKRHVVRDIKNGTTWNEVTKHKQ